MENATIRGMSEEERQARSHVGIATLCAAATMLVTTGIAARALWSWPLEQHVFPFPQLLAGLSLLLAAQVIALIYLFQERKNFTVDWAWPRWRAERPEPVLAIEATGTGALRPVDTEEARIANSPRRLFIAEGPLFTAGFPSLLAATAILWIRTRPPPPGWIVQGANMVKETTTASGLVVSREVTQGFPIEQQLVWILYSASMSIARWWLPLAVLLAAMGAALLLRSRSGRVALNRRVDAEVAAVLLAAAAVVLLHRHWRYGYWLMEFGVWYIHLAIDWWRWTVPGLAFVGVAALAAGCRMEHQRLNGAAVSR